MQEMYQQLRDTLSEPAKEIRSISKDTIVLTLALCAVAEQIHKFQTDNGKLRKEVESLKALLFDCQSCVDSPGLAKEIQVAIKDYEAKVREERRK